MKNQSTKIIVLGILTAVFIFLSFFNSKSEPFKGNDPIASNSIKYLKQEAFQILEAKCNACHRKQNPFMVFSVKNMEKRASKIHQQVFITKRMPKGDEIKLTSNEHAILKEWLINLNSATKKTPSNPSLRGTKQS
jgi:uncharacterized membrane protein